MIKKKRRVSRFLFLNFLFLFGCEEFYDEEFEEFNEDTTISTTSNNRLIYKAELFSTDPNLTNLNGFVTIDIESETAKIDLNSDGIPENYFQLTYTYSSSTCETISISIPSLEEDIGERSYSIQEEITADALNKDLKASGSSSGGGDINLNGKYFLVKARVNLSDQPIESGSNQVAILCGILETWESGEATSQDDVDVLNVPPPTSSSL